MYLAKLEERYIAKKLGLHITAIQKILRLIARLGRRFNGREEVIEKED